MVRLVILLKNKTSTSVRTTPIKVYETPFRHKRGIANKIKITDKHLLLKAQIVRWLFFVTLNKTYKKQNPPLTKV